MNFDSNIDYQAKYLKYKKKYLNQKGGDIGLIYNYTKFKNIKNIFIINDSGQKRLVTIFKKNEYEIHVSSVLHENQLEFCKKNIMVSKSGTVYIVPKELPYINPEGARIIDDYTQITDPSKTPKITNIQKNIVHENINFGFSKDNRLYVTLIPNK